MYMDTRARTSDRRCTCVLVFQISCIAVHIMLYYLVLVSQYVFVLHALKCMEHKIIYLPKGLPSNFTTVMYSLRSPSIAFDSTHLSF